MKDKLILNNQSQIEIESGASLSDIKVLSQTKQDMVFAWDMLTPENLKSVQIQNSDGTTVANYTDLILENETSTVQSDGTILTSFHLREKTELEKLREEVAQLKEGQDVQDEAISELGTVVSDLSGGI